MTVPLREDYDAAQARCHASRCDDSNQARRLLSIAAVYDGMTRAEAARVGGMDRQTLRDRVHRFNRHGPDGLMDGKAPGASPKLTPSQLEELAAVVETGPNPLSDGIVRWRRVDLKGWIEAHSGVVYHERSVSRLLEQMGFSHISARPRHPGQDEAVMEDFKKDFPRTLAASIGHLPPDTSIELWWQDEMRLGRKNGLVRQWARRGTRPRQPKDQRYQNTCLFGAICPARGRGAALVMPYASTHAMQAHLNEISLAVAPGAHAVLLMDRAGWHTTGELHMPGNITPVFLPCRAPELDPVENIWQFLRQTCLSNRVFEDYDEIVEAACQAWNRLVDQPWQIISIGLRDWAHRDWAHNGHHQ